jgi:methionyl aminopeptidase
VPNYENRLSNDTLTEGLVIAIEPMLAAVPTRPIQGADGWTLSTHNGSLAVHEEHTVVIQRGVPLILTAA